MQESYTDSNIVEKDGKKETYQMCPTKQSLSPMPDIRNEISPLRRMPPGLFNTPIQSAGLEDIREEDNEHDSTDSAHNPPPCTTFTLLPSHTTPPSRQNTVRNPFDAALIKRLHLPIFSPSVFKRVVSPTQDMHQFCWTIDDVAKIQPAPIEYQPQQYEQAIDPETELKAQEAIDHYFCNTHTVSSPWGPQLPNRTSTLFVETNIDSSVDEEISLRNVDDNGQDPMSGTTDVNISIKKEVSTQTMLTLPPELPPTLEAALKPYFTFSEEQSELTEEANLSTSTLRRKLFVHEEDQKDMCISPVRSSCFSMQVECKLNSPTCSGLLVTTSSRILCPSPPIINSRTYGTPLPGSKIVSSPEMSPIGSFTVQQRNKSVTRLNFSRKIMSVDKSAISSPSISPLGLVPIQHDDDHGTVQKTTSCLSSSSSSAMITSQTSTPVKRDLESFNSTSAMITSETSTPIKEIFVPFNDVSMENIHFKQIQNKLREFGNADNCTIEEDITNLNSFSLQSTAGNSHDTGYQTGSVSCNMTGSAFTSLSSVSKTWTGVHIKTSGGKHISASNEGFASDNCNSANKGLSVPLEDNSLWLPSSRHIVSSTPTKICG